MIERLGDQVLGPEVQPGQAIRLHHGVGHVLLGQTRQGPGGRQLHLFVDAGRPDVGSKGLRGPSQSPRRCIQRSVLTAANYWTGV